MRKSIGSVNIFIVVAVLAIGGLAAAIVPNAGLITGEPQKVESDEFVFYGSDLLDPDPYSSTDSFDAVAEAAVPDFPKENHLRLIGRLADGIVKQKTAEGGWWECGKFISKKKDLQSKATLYSYEIVKAAYEASDKDDDPGFVLNPWGLAGVVWNESKFDRCALGTHPRKRAYKLGLIKRRRICISHTEDEILSAVESEKLQVYFKKSGFDLGTAQLLSRFYPDRKGFKRMMSVREGTAVAALEMRRRGKVNRTKRPWLYWRGRRACEWYDRKVSRGARKLGAGPGEI